MRRTSTMTALIVLAVASTSACISVAATADRSVDLAIQVRCSAPDRITVELFNVSEFEASSGQITVLVDKHSGWDGLDITGGDWILDTESDPDNYRVSSDISIAAGGSFGSADNLGGKNSTSTFDVAPISFQRPLAHPITVTIADNAGGDTNSSNNSASAQLPSC